MDRNSLHNSSYDPMEFFYFGMDRIDAMPDWQAMEYDLPILHLGPGKKGDQLDTIDLEYPEYDFDTSIPLIPVQEYFNLHLTEPVSPWKDNSVGGIVATHVLEHLKDPRPLIWECGRVLAPGCPLSIVVPKAGSNLWNQDLDHKTGFVLDTWKTLLDSSFYVKGKNIQHKLSVGFNMEMSMKEGNNVIVTQLIKEGE